MKLVDQMKSFRENFPIIIAWLGYQIIVIVLSKFILVPLSASDVRSSNPYWLVFLFVIDAFIGYLSFVASVHWIVSPVLRHIKNIAKKSKRDFLIVEWLTLSILVFAFNLPLVYTGIIPFSKSTSEIIVFAWKIIVSLFVYRGVVSGYVSENSKTATSEIEQQATSA
jgi:hypothetical protein